MLSFSYCNYNTLQLDTDVRQNAGFANVAPSKIAQIFPLHLNFGIPFVVIPLEFHQDIWQKKTESTGHRAELTAG